jgi:hypothetical protein
MKWSWTALKNPMIYLLQVRKITKISLKTANLQVGTSSLDLPNMKGEYHAFSYDTVLGFVAEGTQNSITD